MAVSRTLSFVVGLSLPGLVAFVAIGEDIPTGKTEYHHVGEITTQVDGSPLQLDASTSGHTGAPAVWKCKDPLSEQILEDYLEKCTRSKACDIGLAKKICETEHSWINLSGVNASGDTAEMIKLRDIAARLYRMENLLREMCATMPPSNYAGCEELRQQQ